MAGNSFALQLAGKRRYGFIVAMHILAIVVKEPGQGAHANTPDAQEIVQLIV
jgi:hypothetical protein